MANIGTRIKQKRLEKGLSQEELAKRLGYKSKSTINKIEKGINDITQSNIVKFANALDTTPAYLMGWDQEEIDVASKNQEESFFDTHSVDIQYGDLSIEVKQMIHNQKMFKEELGNIAFSDEEVNQIIAYARLLISARK